jgi:hypothetical protein
MYRVESSLDKYRFKNSLRAETLYCSSELENLGIDSIKGISAILNSMPYIEACISALIGISNINAGTIVLIPIPDIKADIHAMIPIAECEAPIFVLIPVAKIDGHIFLLPSVAGTRVGT